MPGDQSVNEQGSIPIAVETQQARDFAITVDVTCTRTDAALVQWQVDTFSALINAHASLVSDYQDKLKAQQIADATAPFPVRGRPASTADATAIPWLGCGELPALGSGSR